MTKQKDSGGGDLTLIILILLVIAIAAVIAPIFLIGALIYYTLKFKKQYPKLSGTYRDFWLNESEKEEFKKWYKLEVDSKKMIDEANQMADDHDLSRNMDGRISSRSDLGKKLLEVMSENRDVLRDASRSLGYLSRKPLRQWNEFLESFKNYFAIRISSIVYFIALPIMCQFKYFKLNIQDALLFVYNLYRGIGDKEYGIGKYVYKENMFGLILVAGIAVVSYFLARYFSYKQANKLTPEPPEIDIDIIDEI